MTMIHSRPDTVSVIGLGDMGTALANTFLKAGYPTTVWNRTARKANALVNKGAQRAASVAEAISASEVVVVCVLDYAVMQEILHAAEDILPGRLLVNLTNGTPQQARKTAAWAAACGAEYLDGGIMATPSMIGQPEAFILYSGSAVAFDAGQAILNTLGGSQYLGADAGLASLYDLSLLSGMYGLFAGFLHATALVGTEKVEARAFTPMLTSWLKVMLQVLPNLAEQIDTGRYDGAVESNLSMQAAAYHNILQASREQGLDPGLMTPLKTLMDQRLAEGYGTDDLSGLIPLIRKPTMYHTS